MTEVTVETLRGASPAEFAQVVKEVKDDEVRSVFAGPQRLAVLEALFDRFPTFFRPDRATGVDARINVRITGRPDGDSDTYALVVADGTCTVEKEPQVEPTVSLMMGPVELFKLLSRSANPVLMAMTGRLKVRGDLSLAQRFADYFDIPEG